MDYGAGKDEKGAYGILVYVHDDEGTARNNADRLRTLLTKESSFLPNRAWADRVTSSDVSTQGRVLYAKLYSTSPRIAIDSYLNLDNFYLVR